MNDLQLQLHEIAAQVRKPSGIVAAQVAQMMDRANESLYDLTLKSMSLKGNERILEIGFGSGSFLPKLFQQSGNLKVTGIDYSSEMVDIARLKNKDLISAGKLILEGGSSEKLPFADGSFDKVYCNMVIFFWDRAENHLREIMRVLNPDGKFYSGFRTRKSMMQLPFVKYGFHLYEPSEWQTILENNGFDVIQSKRKLDKEADVNGQKIQLESVCLVAKKQSSRTN